MASTTLTLEKIAVLIAEPFKRQFDRPFLDMIKERVMYWRTVHMRRSLRKDPSRRAYLKQFITMRMRKRKAVECGIDLDCYIAETVLPYPEPISIGSLIFDFVGSVDRSRAFSRTEAGWSQYKEHDKYANKVIKIGYTALNKHIQIYGNEDLPYIGVEGVFADWEAAELARCDGSPKPSDCGHDTAEFNIPDDILQLVIQDIMRIDLNINGGQSPITEVPVNVTDHALNRTS